jgi:chromate transporter
MPPSLGKLALVFARYANLTLGGGSATAATMHRELVVKRKWLSEDQFTLSFALGRVTPGTNLLAFCTRLRLDHSRPGRCHRRLARVVYPLRDPCRGAYRAFGLLAGQQSCSSRLAWCHCRGSGHHNKAKTCWTIAHPYFKGSIGSGP